MIGCVRERASRNLVYGTPALLERGIIQATLVQPTALLLATQAFQIFCAHLQVAQGSIQRRYFMTAQIETLVRVLTLGTE